MVRKRKFTAIDEMKRMLNGTKRLTLESFIMPEEDEYFGDEDMMPSRDEEMREPVQPKGQEISGIEKELTQIRKIALSVINRLADQPTSPQYDTMKKIWNMVDKAIEQPQQERQQQQQ